MTTLEMISSIWMLGSGVCFFGLLMHSVDHRIEMNKSIATVVAWPLVVALLVVRGLANIWEDA